MSMFGKRSAAEEVRRIVSEFRLRHDLSYRRMARLVGVETGQIYRFLTGKLSHGPSTVLCDKLIAMQNAGDSVWSAAEHDVLVFFRDYDANHGLS